MPVVPIDTDLDFKGYAHLLNLPAPVNPGDGVPKSYVDGFNGSRIVVPQLLVVGHSQNDGSDLHRWENRWTTRLARMLHTHERNISIGGAVACWPQSNAPKHWYTTGDGGYAWVLQDVLTRRSDAPYGSTTGSDTGAPYWPETSLCVAHYGLNDLANLGVSNLVPVQEAMRTVINRLRAAQVYEENDGSVVFGGGYTWSNFASRQYNSGAGYQQISTGSGTATVTITVPSDHTGTISYNLLVGSNWSGNISVTVDGVAYGSSYSYNGATMCGNGKSIGISRRITGLTLGASHTIVISATSILNGFAFDCWAMEAKPLPLVLVPYSYRLYNWAVYNGYPYHPVDADVVTLNNALQTVVNEYDSHVVPVDLETILAPGGTAFNPVGTKDITNWQAPNNWHPSPKGHALIANALITAIQAASVWTQSEVAQSAPYVGAPGNVLWIAPTLLNGWVAYDATGGTTGVPRFRRDAYGMVTIQGAVKSGSSAGVAIFTLPRGYAPNQAFTWWGRNISNQTVAGMLITPQPDGTGSVTCFTNGSTAGIDMLNVTFPAETP